MGVLRMQTISVTTAADGSATVYSEDINGKVHTIQYVKTDFANGVDFNIFTETTNREIWDQDDVNASAYKNVVVERSWYDGTIAYIGPSAPTTDTDNTHIATDKIYVAGERVKFGIANGGNAKTGTFYLIWEDMS